MMFTKQHYERIARTLAETAGSFEDTIADAAVEEVRTYIANELADMFAEDNVRFSRPTFLSAAQVPVQRIPAGETHERQKAVRAARRRERRGGVS